MQIERLSVENLREGIFCAAGRPEADEWYSNLEAWLDGSVLHGSFARGDDGVVMGFVLYLDLERSLAEVEGKGYYMLQCLFVKPKYQGLGVGKALIESALDDARARGASGFICEGFRSGPKGYRDFLPETFFQHRDMHCGESRGLATLYYTRFTPSAEQPRYAPINFAPQCEEKIRVDIFDCGRCFHDITNRNVVEEVLSQIDSQKIEVHVHKHNTRETVLDRGMSSGVFVDGKLTFFQGPISEEDILHAIDIATEERAQSEGRHK